MVYPGPNLSFVLLWLYKIICIYFVCIHLCHISLAIFSSTPTFEGWWVITWFNECCSLLEVGEQSKQLLPHWTVSNCWEWVIFSRPTDHMHGQNWALLINIWTYSAKCDCLGIRFFGSFVRFFYQQKPRWLTNNRSTVGSSYNFSVFRWELRNSFEYVRLQISLGKGSPCSLLNMNVQYNCSSNQWSIFTTVLLYLVIDYMHHALLNGMNGQCDYHFTVTCMKPFHVLINFIHLISVDMEIIRMTLCLLQDNPEDSLFFPSPPPPINSVVFLCMSTFIFHFVQLLHLRFP